MALPETPPVVILAVRREPHLQQLARAEGLPHALQETLLCIQDGDGSLWRRKQATSMDHLLQNLSQSQEHPTTGLFLMPDRHEDDQSSLPVLGRLPANSRKAALGVDGAHKRTMWGAMQDQSPVCWV